MHSFTTRPLNSRHHISPTLETSALFYLYSVDFSEEQIRRAKRNIPEADLLIADISDLEFKEGCFKAITAFYVIFHLPREDQVALFEHMASWLQTRGILLASVSLFDEKPYTEDHFFGGQMYWTNFNLDGYRQIARDVGLEPLDLPDQYRFDEGPERHPLLLAQRINR